LKTSGEGEINAHSRVQMAWAKPASRRARSLTRRFFHRKSLAGIRDYASGIHRCAARFNPIPRRPGIAGPAANFALHVADLMDSRAALARLPGEH